MRPAGRATNAGSVRPPPVVRRRTRSPKGIGSPGRPLGPRQIAALGELAAAVDGLAGPDVAGRHGTSAVAGLVRRGLVEAETRERPRRPLAARPPGLRGGRPPAASLSPEQAEAVSRALEAIRPPRRTAAAARRRDRRGQDRDLRRGDRCLAGGGPPGTRPGARDLDGDAARRPVAVRPRRQGRARPFRPRRRRARG